MGIFWHTQDHYARCGFGPKLTVTGRLAGSLLGRPVELEASGRELLLRIPNLRSAWRLRRSASTSIHPLLRSLSAYGIALRVRVGSRLTVEVLPQPSFGLRLLMPSLSRTAWHVAPRRI